MNLEELKNTEILLFGKSRAFSNEEFISQLKHHQITITKEFNPQIKFVIEGRMMTPYEQDESERLYKTQTSKFISIDELEKKLANEIDEDTLLMSLKLSHDKGRLKDFLQNSKISDKLFFKLLKIYSWRDEDFFENDDNRDVSAAFISRFYENIERNHNVQYATTGFIHLISQAKDSELLREIATLKPLQFHPKIDAAIAMSPYCDEKLQKKLFRRSEKHILEALSFNTKLEFTIIKEFLKTPLLAANVARSIALKEEYFELLKEYSSSLAQNGSLSSSMQESLLNEQSREINLALATNTNLSIEMVDKLIKQEDETILELIYSNSATPIFILEKAYEDEKNHLALCKNESTPIEILYQLQLDSRYERYVKTNAGYGRHIQRENIGWL